MNLDFSSFYDVAILALRVIVAIVFFSSGRAHASDPQGRAKSIGLSPAATAVLGVAEILGAVMVAVGIFPRIGAMVLIFTMLGAIYKKIVVWKTGFYAEKGYGWHYDLILLCACLVVFALPGGIVLVIV